MILEIAAAIIVAVIVLVALSVIGAFAIEHRAALQVALFVAIIGLAALFFQPVAGYALDFVVCAAPFGLVVLLINWWDERSIRRRSDEDRQRKGY